MTEKVANSPSEFRQEFLDMVDIVIRPWLNPEKAKERGFAFNKASMERINQAANELKRAIAEGAIKPTPAYHQDANVVYLENPTTK